ncbi:hypothetical protein K439DRAFT_1622809 [Ramaria rubella]|nr:hypothetical protein K439DRAFT_1622809 [Ramaria rubella]
MPVTTVLSYGFAVEPDSFLSAPTTSHTTIFSPAAMASFLPPGASLCFPDGQLMGRAQVSPSQSLSTMPLLAKHVPTPGVASTISHSTPATATTVPLTRTCGPDQTSVDFVRGVGWIRSEQRHTRDNTDQVLPSRTLKIKSLPPELLPAFLNLARVSSPIPSSQSSSTTPLHRLQVTRSSETPSLSKIPCLSTSHPFQSIHSTPDLLLLPL